MDERLLLMLESKEEVKAKDLFNLLAVVEKREII